MTHTQASSHERSMFQTALKSHAKAMNLEALARSQPTGRVMTYSNLEEILLDSIEALFRSGAPNPSSDPEGFRNKAREMLSEMVRKRASSNLVAA